MFSNLDGLSIGAGDKYGLYIDKLLLEGYSYPCDTFDNRRLSKEKDFKILKMEVDISFQFN